MAFEGLTSKLQDTIKKLRGKGKLTDKDIKDAMREVKLALLEADVNFKVVKDFIKDVSEKSMGEAVMQSLTPGQQVIKVVNDELVRLMGTTESKIKFSATGGPTIIMLVGLQGAGKTTMAGKLALQLRKSNKKPLLVACDIYRPAAIKQLQVIGKQIEIPVFAMGDDISPVDISKAAKEYAKNNGNDVLIIDTAGRLHIDEVLMQELKDVKDTILPDEILLVVDSMTGQDAVNVSENFNNLLDITGVVLTKLDGDTRGGAALSIRAITGKPIKYAGMGEKMNDLEIFYPERMASRILGMGDVLSLIEKAQSAISEKDAKELGERMLSKEFNFDDFLNAMTQMKKMGPMSKVLEMIPGVGNQLKGMDLSQTEKEADRTETIIFSMTKKERKNPTLLSSSPSRKKRVASGSGTRIQDVNILLKKFEMMKKMMKQMNGGGLPKGMSKGLLGKLPFM